MAAAIFKILTGPQWALWTEQGLTYGSHDDRRDGFIHFSGGHQVMGTLEKHFTKSPFVWLVSAKPETMGPGLKWEPARNGQLFPHLFEPFKKRHAGREWMVARTPDGHWHLPQEVTQC